MRKAARVDRNQAEIVAALRAIGCSVQPLHSIGQGCPDLLIGYRGVNHLAEIKDGERPPSERELTPDQAKWHVEWRGHAMVITSVEEALAFVTEAT